MKIIARYRDFKNDFLLFKTLLSKSTSKGNSYLNGFASWSQFLKWRHSLIDGVSSISERMPWMTIDAIEMLEDKLSNQARVFEFGGGGSTLFFLDRVAEVNTVEHDSIWFEELLKNTEKSKKWNGLLMEPKRIDNFSSLSQSNPEHYISDDPKFINFSFEDYVKAIDKFPDNYFDLVSIDGRSRPSCIKHAISKIKKGGWLLLDNAEREYYQPAMDLLKPESFKVVLNKEGLLIFCRWTTTTRIWEKI
jgi:hypothetical protein